MIMEFSLVVGFCNLGFGRRKRKWS